MALPSLAHRCCAAQALGALAGAALPQKLAGDHGGHGGLVQAVSIGRRPAEPGQVSAEGVAQVMGTARG